MSRKRKGKKRQNRKKSPAGVQPLFYEVIGLLMIGLAVIIIFEFGPAGRGLSSATRFLFGNLHIAIPFLLIVQALIFMIMRKVGGWKNRIMAGSLFILASLLLFSHVHLFKELNESRILLSNSALKETWNVLIVNDGIIDRTGALGGGMIGAFLFAMFYSLFDSAGATVAGVLLLLIGIVLLTGKALVPMIAENFPKLFESFKKTFSEKRTRKKKEKKPAKVEPKPTTRTRRSQVKEEVVAVEPIIEDTPSQPIISAFTEQIDKRAKEEEAVSLVEKEVVTTTQHTEVEKIGRLLVRKKMRLINCRQRLY